MFTGIIEGLGKVERIAVNGRPATLGIGLPRGWKLKHGESVAVNGVCLSVRSLSKGRAVFDCVLETLRRTALSGLKPGEPVNLERSLRLSDRIGGHLVSGHVDGVGVIRSIKPEGTSSRLAIGGLKKLSRFFVEKGSVAVDGVSLTIARVFAGGFTVALIPLTRQVTTLGRKKAGDPVNVEVDAFVKIAERLLAG